MDRRQLEALSAEELQRLIAEAAAVLAARAGASTGTCGTSGVVDPAAQGSASSGSLFTFGATSAETGASVQPAGLFNPFAPGQSSGLFGGLGTTGSSGCGKLFGGTGAGLFSNLSAGPGAVSGGDGLRAPAFAPPSRTGGAGGEKAEAGAAAEAAERPDGEAGEDRAGDGDDDDRDAPDEEVTLVPGWTPSITLEVVGTIETGEEGEEEVYSQRSKLYRFRAGEWKERGLGEARLMKDKTTGRVRFLLRQERTGKVVANHYVIDHKTYCDLRPNAESDKIWVWAAQDWSDGDLNVEEFALKFGTVELAGKFKEAFEDAKKQNAKVVSEEAKSKEDSKEDVSSAVAA